MSDDFTHATFGKLGNRVCRLGLSATYRPGKAAIHRALDAGVNVFFFFGIDTQMVKVLRDVLPGRREQLVLATGPYNFIWGYTDPRKNVEKRLRALKTDYLDACLLLGVLKEKEFPPRVRDEMRQLREEGKIRGIGLSTHNRLLAGQLAAAGEVDVLMIRYNAAHRGAETEIFPQLAAHDPALISYTATRWRGMLHRPRGWPKTGPVPAPAQAYRFVLSNPHVDVVLTAPSNAKQLEENLAALAQGPLSPEEMRMLRAFGDAVHQRRRWFM
jgi:aryl-alcohol dehydrogenase-like predicted oxidoreductase